MSEKLHIGVIVASTRPVRNGSQVAAWVKQATDTDDGAEYTYLDLADINLPFLAEPNVPSQGNYALESTKNWAKQVAAQDGFLVITPEYNHGYPASLKNALDTLYAEWLRKPIAFVGYGVVGATRSIEQLNNVVLNLEMHPLANVTTNIPLFDYMNEQGQFVPTDRLQRSLESTLSALKEWSELFKRLRSA